MTNEKVVTLKSGNNEVDFHLIITDEKLSSRKINDEHFYEWWWPLPGLYAYVKVMLDIER